VIAGLTKSDLIGYRGLVEQIKERHRQELGKQWQEVELKWTYSSFMVVRSGQLINSLLSLFDRQGVCLKLGI